MNFELLAADGRDFVRDVRRRLHEVDIGILLQPLLHDFHVQQAEEAAAEAEAERVARFGLEFEAGIVDRELVERFAELLEVLAVGRIQAAEDHPLRLFVAGQRGGRLAVGDRHRVADVDVAERLDVADDVADLAGGELVAADAPRRELAELDDVVRRAGLQELDPRALADRAVHDADVRDRAAVLVVHRVEHHRLQHGVRIARRRRHALEHGLQHGFAVEARLRAAADDFVGIDRQRVLDFFLDFVDAGVREIDLVDHRHDRQIVLHRRVGVGDRLRFDALKRIDQQHGPFAAHERPRHFVVKIDVARACRSG